MLGFSISLFFLSLGSRCLNFGFWWKNLLSLMGEFASRLCYTIHLANLFVENTHELINFVRAENSPAVSWISFLSHWLKRDVSNLLFDLGSQSLNVHHIASVNLLLFLNNFIELLHLLDDESLSLILSKLSNLLCACSHYFLKLNRNKHTLGSYYLILFLNLANCWVNLWVAGLMSVS
jgi:hypothetical protein